MRRANLIRRWAGAARRRGIPFRLRQRINGHSNWATVEAATKQDFWPDTFSTDWNASRAPPRDRYAKRHVEADHARHAAECGDRGRTCNAARIFPWFDDRGTLNVGAPATWRSWNYGRGTTNSRQLQGTRTGSSGCFRLRPCSTAKRTPARA